MFAAAHLAPVSSGFFGVVGNEACVIGSVAFGDALHGHLVVISPCAHRAIALLLEGVLFGAHAR